MINMINIHYWLTKNTGEVVAQLNQPCFASIRELISRQEDQLRFRRAKEGSEEDIWNIAALRSKKEKLVSLRFTCQAMIESQAWIDFLINLPIFKGLCTATFSSVKDIDDEDSPFSVMKTQTKEYIKAELEKNVGYYDVTVSLEHMSSQMSFSFLSCIRYVRDYPWIVKVFDYMVSTLEYHPYLAFIISSNLSPRDGIPYDLKKMRVYGCTASGHHTLSRVSSTSMGLLDLLYHKKYPKGSDVSSYSESMTIPNSQIRFHSPKGNELGVKLGLSDKVLPDICNGTTDLTLVDVPKCNKIIADLISGEEEVVEEVSTETYINEHMSSVYHQVQKDARRFLPEGHRRSAQMTGNPCAEVFLDREDKVNATQPKPRKKESARVRQQFVLPNVRFVRGTDYIVQPIRKGDQGGKPRSVHRGI